MHDVSILLQIVLVAVFSYRRSLDPRYDDDDDDSICNYVQLLYNRIIDNGYFFYWQHCAQCKRGYFNLLELLGGGEFEIFPQGRHAIPIG